MKPLYKKITFFSVLTFCLVLLDQLTKYLIYHYQPFWSTSFLQIHFTKNTGAGFGLLSQYTFLLTIISILVTAFIIYYYPKIPKETFPQLAASLFLAGTIGNLIDRLARKFVIDFIDFSFWPAFNLADTCITLGALGLIIYFWKK